MNDPLDPNSDEITKMTKLNCLLSKRVILQDLKRTSFTIDNIYQMALRIRRLIEFMTLGKQ
jgi:hypothetical protein